MDNNHLNDLWTWLLQRRKKESPPFETCLELFKKKKRRANNCCRCSVKALTANSADLANAQLGNKSPRGGHAVVLGHKYSSRFSQERSTIMVDSTILAEVGMSEVDDGTRVCRWCVESLLAHLTPTSSQLRWGDGTSPVCSSCGESGMSEINLRSTFEITSRN